MAEIVRRAGGSYTRAMSDQGGGEHGGETRAGGAGRPRVIALMNQKGGVGKTTTTVNLAAGIARAGHRTLVVDLDPQAHASLHLGYEAPAEGEPVGVYDVLADPAADAGAAVARLRENLALMPSETDLAGAEAELTGAARAHHRLSDALGRLAGQFDVALIDCPPSLGLLTLNGLAAASEVIIPMQSHFLALQGVGKLLETVQQVRAHGINPTLRVSGVVLCMHDRQSTHAQEVTSDIAAFFAGAPEGSPWDGARIFQPPIRRNIKLAECPSFGQTIFEYAPDANGAEDYAALASDVLGSSAEADAPDPPVAEIGTTEAGREHGGGGDHQQEHHAAHHPAPQPTHEPVQSAHGPHAG